MPAKLDLNGIFLQGTAAQGQAYGGTDEIRIVEFDPRALIAVIVQDFIAPGY